MSRTVITRHRTRPFPSAVISTGIPTPEPWGWEEEFDWIDRQTKISSAISRLVAAFGVELISNGDGGHNVVASGHDLRFPDTVPALLALGDLPVPPEQEHKINRALGSLGTSREQLAGETRRPHFARGGRVGGIGIPVRLDPGDHVVIPRRLGRAS